MRFFRPHLARRDIVELLVRQGRLADLQMLNFFSMQVEREMAIAAAKDVRDMATTTSATTEVQAATAGDATTETATKNANQEVWASLNDRSMAVRKLAREQGPTAWMPSVFTEGEEWCSSFTSAARAKASTEDAPAASEVQVSGIAMAVGEGTGKPSSIRVVLRLGDGEPSSSSYVTASVRLNQPGVVANMMVNGMLQVTLDKASATLHRALSAAEMACGQHVLTASAYGAILRKVEEVCALHATNTVSYDAVLLRNPAMQMHLAQLACFRYGIECLTDYVLGNPELTEPDVVTALNRAEKGTTIPMIESLALNIYAERALMDGMDGMWEMVRDTPLVEAIPHRSQPAKVIDYPYLAHLLRSSKYVLTSSDGSMEEQALTFLRPLLVECGGSVTAGGSQRGLGAMIQSLLGFTGGSEGKGVRLSAPHVNLTTMARTLERDMVRFLQMMDAEPNKGEPTFVIYAAQYLSEVFANLAVLYRCTAALNADETGRGHREWLLTEAFGASSASRRQRLLDDYEMARGARKALRKIKDLDNYSTHPVELMNATARGGKTTAQTAKS